MTKKSLAVILLGAVALSFLLYGNTISGSFVYDDKFFAERQDLSKAEALGRIWSEPFLPQNPDAGMYRPLTVFTLALNFLLFGRGTESFHIFSIVLNGLVVLLVGLAVFKIFEDKRLALFSALFFAFLPIHTEAVAFIKARDELLSTLFVLLAWLAFLKKRVLLSSLLFLLAVLAKELVILTPLLFLLTFWFRQKASFARVVKVGLIFAPATIGYLLLRYFVLGQYAFGKDDTYFVINPLGTAEFWVRLWTAFKIAFIYISKIFVPYNLSATYHYNQLTSVSNPFISWQALAGLFLLAVLIFMLIWRRTRQTPLAIGAAAFLIPYLVVSKFVFKGGDIMGERWMYLPSIGLSIIAGRALSRVYIRKKLAAALILGLILGIYGYVAFNRNKVWLSNRALFESMVEDAPRSLQGHLNMANLYLENDYLDQARREVEAGFKIYPEHPPLLNLAGIIAYKDGSYDFAEKAFLRAKELQPRLWTTYSNLGRLYYNTGQYSDAEENLKKVVELSNKPEDIMLYALTLAKLKRYQDSLEIMDKFFREQQNNSQVRFILAVNYFKLGNLNEAGKYFDWNKNKTAAEKIKILQSF